MFQSVTKRVFQKLGYDRLLQPQFLQQIYLDYRDIGDINILIIKLDEARENFQAIIDEEEKRRQAELRTNHGMLSLPPEPGSWAETFAIQNMMNNIRANCKVDVLEFLVKAHANRKGIVLTDDLRQEKD